MILTLLERAHEKEDAFKEKSDSFFGETDASRRGRRKNERRACRKTQGWRLSEIGNR
jgi:hypothetical protein